MLRNKISKVYTAVFCFSFSENKNSILTILVQNKNGGTPAKMQRMPKAIPESS